MLEALLATIIRPCLGQGSNKSTPMPKDDANELFGTLRAEEILAINTAFREQLRVRGSNGHVLLCGPPTLRAANGMKPSSGASFPPVPTLTPHTFSPKLVLKLDLVAASWRLGRRTAPVSDEYRCRVMYAAVGCTSVAQSAFRPPSPVVVVAS